MFDKASASGFRAFQVDRDVIGEQRPGAEPVGAPFAVFADLHVREKWEQGRIGGSQSVFKNVAGPLLDDPGNTQIDLWNLRNSATHNDGVVDERTNPNTRSAKQNRGFPKDIRTRPLNWVVAERSHVYVGGAARVFELFFGQTAAVQPEAVETTPSMIPVSM